MITRFKLFESPDFLSYKNKEIYWDDSTDNYTFGYYKNKNTKKYEFYYSDILSHYKIYSEYGDEINDRIADKYDGRSKMAGRLFTEQKVITFWNYPKNQNELKMIAEDIKKNIGIDIYKEKYEIEVLLDKSAIINPYDWELLNRFAENDEVKLIPVEDYKKSRKRTKEELKSPHLANWKEKEKILKDKGFKPKIKQWKEWQKPFESKLYENPNYITYKDKNIKYCSYEDIIVFSYYRNINTGEYKFFYMKNETNSTHGDLFHNANKFGNDYFANDYRGKYAGRLFPHEKIISFWNFPENQEKMKKVAEDILENTGIDVYKENYVVEILKKDTVINDTDWGEWEFPKEDEIDFIPVEKYYGSMKRKEEELNIPHIMSPKEKEKLLKDKGFKPKIKQWKEWQKPFENKNN